jgi:hypothetical protein
MISRSETRGATRWSNGCGGGWSRRARNYPKLTPRRSPLGEGWQDGFWIELEDGSGFIEYVLIDEPDGGQSAVLYQLLWY